MIATIKWIIALLGTAIAWLVTSYTIEYFRPYKWR